MKIQKKTNKTAVNHPNKVFWYCKVCKGRREEWKSKQKYSTFPFCSSSCKQKFYRNHAFTSEPNSYKRFFSKERFKIWIHNQISVFTPQFTRIRQDRQFRKLVRDEMWAMRYELSLPEAIQFIVFMLKEFDIPYLNDREVFMQVYGTHITALILQENVVESLDYFRQAVELLEE